MHKLLVGALAALLLIAVPSTVSAQEIREVRFTGVGKRFTLMISGGAVEQTCQYEGKNVYACELTLVFRDGETKVVLVRRHNGCTHTFFVTAAGMDSYHVPNRCSKTGR